MGMEQVCGRGGGERPGSIAGCGQLGLGQVVKQAGMEGGQARAPGKGCSEQPTR